MHSRVQACSLFITHHCSLEWRITGSPCINRLVNKKNSFFTERQERIALKKLFFLLFLFFIVDHVNLTICRTTVTTYRTRAADNLIKKTDARKLFNFNTNNMSKLFPLCYRRTRWMNYRPPYLSIYHHLVTVTGHKLIFVYWQMFRRATVANQRVFFRN